MGNHHKRDSLLYSSHAEIEADSATQGDVQLKQVMFHPYLN